MSGDNGHRRTHGDDSSELTTATIVTLECRAERRLIRHAGSFRHLDFLIRVGARPSPSAAQRAPLALAVVLDRSGSMSGTKLATAKKAVLSVLERLDERDQVALVAFDDRIDVLQPAAPASATTREHIRRQLAHLEARATTALHEGWLTGCNAIAADSPAAAGRLARCFLLTDGLANVGMTDPERIASEAAGVLAHAGIGTSTFGVGSDYAEGLLGPMAVAGGGQFHHLRTADDIASTFLGELGELLSVAAEKVRLELDGGGDITVEVISQYWASQPLRGISTVSVAVGDLPAEAERHVVIRFGFPPRGELPERTLRARVTWSARGRDLSTTWQEIRFTYADRASCDAELRERLDRAVMHWVGLHHAQRAKRTATELNRDGNFQAARDILRRVARRIAAYAGDDPALRAAVVELEALADELGSRPMQPMAAKEMIFETMRESRGQKDFRLP